MKQLKFVLAAFAAAGLVGCATGPEPEPESRSKEELILERAQARWDALVNREMELAYSFYTPGYRQTTSAVEFGAAMTGRPVVWTSAEVDSVECESEQKCSVSTNVSYRVPGGPTGINTMRMTRVLKETWLNLGGEWWYSRQ
jgi:hypothetical protein